MKKKTMTCAAIALLLAGCEFGDELIACTAGSPLRLVSATGSLDAYDARHVVLKPLLQASLHEGDLRVIVRTSFYSSGSLARPYLTVDQQRNGIIHIDAKSRLGFATKCEFLRQFEVDIPEAQWKQLISLQVYNHDTTYSTSRLDFSSPALLAKLLHDSHEKLALRDLSGVGRGC